MPGLFSRVGTYLAGSEMRAAAGNIGQLAMFAAKGGLGRTTAGALYGAAAGGLYGALSSNTSVLGGMMGGAALGAGGARYGGAGVRRGMLGYRGIGVSDVRTIGFGQGFAKGVSNMARQDARGVRMAANQGYGKIRGLF